LTPGARVRDVGRIGVAGSDADLFADAPIAADNRLPIIDAVGLAGKPFAGIGEIGDAKVKIDRCNLGADTAGKGELGSWLGRQLDGGDRGAGV
jgi:hypothetical protein